MKITRQQLEEIIKEELQNLLQEDPNNLEEDWKRKLGGALGGAALAMGTLGAAPPVSAKAPTTATTQVKKSHKMNVLNKAGGLINAAAAGEPTKPLAKALHAALKSAETDGELTNDEARDIFFTARDGATGKLSGKDALEKIQSILYRS